MVRPRAPKRAVHHANGALVSCAVHNPCNCTVDLIRSTVYGIINSFNRSLLSLPSVRHFPDTGVIVGDKTKYHPSCSLHSNSEVTQTEACVLRLPLY